MKLRKDHLKSHTFLLLNLEDREREEGRERVAAVATAAMAFKGETKKSLERKREKIVTF